jgi:hypothetical protein
MNEDQAEELLDAVGLVIDEYYAIKSSLPTKLDDAINELIISYESIVEDEEE